MDEELADSRPNAPQPEDTPRPKVVEIDVSKKLGDVRVVLRGLSRIHNSTLYPDLKNIRNATTVKELFMLLEDAHERLDKLDLFKSVVSNIRRGKRPGDVDVVFELEEKRPSYSVGVTANQKSEANFELTGEVPGVLGSCNSLSLQLRKSGYGSQKLSGSCFMPRNIGLAKFTSLIQLFTSQNDFTNYSSYSMSTQGISFILSDIKRRHQAIWEASINDLYPSFNDHRRASETVLRHAGRSLKNSVSYQYTIDELKGETIPHTGHCTQMKFEAGLPGGDRQFLKIDYNTFFASVLRQRLILHMNISMGYMKHLGTLRKNSNLLDRFHFTGSGGAGSAFRGFGYRGIGPCDYSSIFDKETQEWKRVPEHTGGDCYGNIQLAFHCPIEYKQYKLPLAFCFLNVGSLTSIEERKNRETIYGHALRQLRMSVGAGFSMGISPGCWMEAFVAQPLLYSPTDTINRLQMGIRFKHNMS
ncbi:hypothetical protein BgAZ_102140 [Babesia gibsoni]|uniref:Bacterial surface antigen (D15) domain-containing protein n=1 Tax=Babesia gibsoni TaxID=33632 RepID=A0AAD8PF68_BABGI|nr:hypothetical protein BgAZ_102140 [Babesia gibsoni]